MRTLSITLILAALAALGRAGAANDGSYADSRCDGTPACCSEAGCQGSPDCCARCGRHTACQKKTCQLVCEVKKEKKYCWTVQCEEFCTLLPGPRERCCDACGENCSGNCCKQNPPPKCGRSKCVQKLVKKEYEVEVPVYKCVVLYLCCDCCKDEPFDSSLPAVKSEAAPSPIPPPPSLPSPNPAPGPKVPKKAPRPRPSAGPKANENAYDLPAPMPTL